MININGDFPRWTIMNDLENDYFDEKEDDHTNNLKNLS